MRSTTLRVNRSTLVTLAGSLAIGAVLSVGSAWVVAIVRVDTTPGDLAMQQSHDTGPRWMVVVDRRLFMQRVRAWPKRPNELTASNLRAPLADLPRWTSAREGPDQRRFSDPRQWLTERCYGVPFVAFRSAVVGDEEGTGDVVEGVEIGGRVLPVRPVFPGMLTNILFFAFVAAVIYLIFHRIRARVRLHYGACPKCGHPLRSARCTECGEDVGTSVRGRRV